MKTLLHKIGFTALITMLFFGLTATQTFAQEDLFDPLDTIKTKLQEDEISVVDYSRDSAWGGLDGELIKILVDAEKTLDDFEGDDLNEIKTKLKDTGEFNVGETSYDEDGVSKSAQDILFALRIKSWGTLPDEIVSILDGEGYANLEAINYDLSICLADEDDPCTMYSFFWEGSFETLRSNNVLTDNDVDLIMKELQFKTGASQINAIITSVAKVMRNLLGALAVIWIIVSGIQMVLAQGDESKITEQKRSITYAVIGLGIVLLLERMIDLFYGVPGAEQVIADRPEGISEEILGVVTFLKALIGSIAILMIIISGIKTIGAQGEEEQITKQRKSILWVIVGLVIIIVNKVVVDNLYRESVGSGSGEKITQAGVGRVIELFGIMTQFVLGFVGLVAFAALIYGAGSMIMNYGNEEMVTNARKIITNALIGIIVVLSAYAIVATVIL